MQKMASIKKTRKASSKKRQSYLHPTYVSTDRVTSISSPTSVRFLSNDSIVSRKSRAATAKKNKEGEAKALEQRLNNIIAMLGLIPGESAMELARAYDSVSPLLKVRTTLNLSPPRSPPNAEKFNLMYVPEEYTPIMRKMSTINRYTTDILLGYRRNQQCGSNLDKIVENCKNELAVLEDNREDKPRVRKTSRKTKTIKPAVLNLDSSFNKIMSPSDIPAPMSSPVKLFKRNPCRSHNVSIPRVKPDAVLSRKMYQANKASPKKIRHRSTNTEPAIVKVLDKDNFLQTDNWPIFYKHIKINRWM